MLAADEYSRDLLPVCSRELDRKRQSVANCWKRLCHNIGGMKLGESQLKSEFPDPCTRGLSWGYLSYFCVMKEKGEMLLPAAGLLCSALGQMSLPCLLSLFSTFECLHLLGQAVKK